jgi:hypothetical protein
MTVEASQARFLFPYRSTFTFANIPGQEPKRAHSTLFSRGR